MNDNRLSPEALLAYNNAFVQSLAALNEAAAAQRAQLLQQVTEALNGGAAHPPADGPVPGAAAPAVPAIPALPDGEGADAYPLLVRCFGLAWQNAVSAQAQVNITALAALTALLTRLLEAPAGSAA